MKLLITFLFFCTFSFASELHVDPNATCDQLLGNFELTDFVHHNMARATNDVDNNLVIFQANLAMISIIEYIGAKNLDFAYFEKLFRRDEAPFWLIANSQPLPLGYVIDLPAKAKALKMGTPLKFDLWVAHNQREVARAFKEALGLSDSQNIENLRQTGVRFKLDPLTN